MLRCLRGCGLLLATALLLAGEAGASSLLPFDDDWESGSIASADWNSWGYPAPLLESGGNAEGNYSLDPNGDSSYLSGLVSANTFTLSGGVRVSIDAYIESALQWSELTFGLANTEALTQDNVHLTHLAVVTIDADIQGSTGYKFYTRFTGDGGVATVYPSVSSGLTPESVFDAWHSYVFDFAADGSAQVRVDGVLAFETGAGFYDYGSDGEFAVLLGGRSHGATINLYDSISATQVPEPTTALLLTVGLAGLGVRRRLR